MELRLVDPRLLLDNPENPRTGAPDLEEDRRLALNIKMVGLVHPPTVRELPDGQLMIIAGHRRRRAAIKAKCATIPVVVTTGDAAMDVLAAGSENMIRQRMSRPDEWRLVEKLRTGQKMSDEKIAKALMRTPTYIRGLSRLARLHPPILHAIEIGRGPDDAGEKLLALTPIDEQEALWAAYFAESVEDGEDPAAYRLQGDEPGDLIEWGDLLSELMQSRFNAVDAAFDDVVAREYGVVWDEDLFGQAGQDNRFTTSRGAYEAAQQHWLENSRPDGSVLMVRDDYGYASAPEGYRRRAYWMTPEDDDVMGYHLDSRTLKIVETPLRACAVSGSGAVSNSTPEPARPKGRADISGTGETMIGEIRTQALHQALDAAQDAVDPWDLVAALLLAFEGDNVSVQGDPTHSYGGRHARQTAIATLFPEGVLVRDPALLRQQSMAVLRSVTNCGVSLHSGSGITAQLMGVLFDADSQMPNMAFEDFLKTMSKPGLTKAVQEAGLETGPKDTGKVMRAAMIAHLGEGRWVPPAAGFAQAVPVWAGKVAAFASIAEDEEDEDEDADAEGGPVDDAADAGAEIAAMDGDDDTGANAAPEEPVAAEDEDRATEDADRGVAARLRDAMTSTPEGRAHFDSHVTFVGVAA